SSSTASQWYRSTAAALASRPRRCCAGGALLSTPGAATWPFSGRAVTVAARSAEGGVSGESKGLIIVPGRPLHHWTGRGREEPSQSPAIWSWGCAVLV